MNTAFEHFQVGDGQVECKIAVKIPTGECVPVAASYAPIEMRFTMSCSHPAPVAWFFWTIQPLSSLFDQCTHIVLDVACLRIAQAKDIDNTRAVAAHANTE